LILRKPGQTQPRGPVQNSGAAEHLQQPVQPVSTAYSGRRVLERRGDIQQGRADQDGLPPEGRLSGHNPANAPRHGQVPGGLCRRLSPRGRHLQEPEPAADGRAQPRPRLPGAEETSHVLHPFVPAVRATGPEAVHGRIQGTPVS